MYVCNALADLSHGDDGVPHRILVFEPQANLRECGSEQCATTHHEQIIARNWSSLRDTQGICEEAGGEDEQPK